MALTFKGEAKLCSTVVQPDVTDALQLEDEYIHQNDAKPTLAYAHHIESHLSAMTSYV